MRDHAGYQPTSDFLIDVLNEDAPLAGSEFAEHNLQRVIACLADADAANRDWAAFILGNSELDTPAIRDTLLVATGDPSRRVAAEALRGLAQKDRGLALPYVQQALAADTVLVNVFEAATIVADPRLADALRRWADPTDDPGFDGLVQLAIAACERGSLPT
ncbi:lyase [Sphingomonas hankookensis]|uniref:lyase n=1 Tax=Sphingomonas hankookensis TaxID=563996 RepID=UPI001F598A5C|nr:lyase [Sphingomonas hankookensis]